MNHKTERDEALAKWQRECEGGSVPVTPMMRHAYRDGWDDALAGQSAGVPTGYALVPIEPTVEMIAALGFAGDADIAIGHARAFKETVDAYASMLAAAPAPVGQSVGVAAEPKRGTDAQILFERRLTCEAINGAIAFGYQNTNRPPSDDHWLAPFWKIGRKQAELEAVLTGPSSSETIHQVWVEKTSSWADVTPAYYSERLPSNRRKVYYKPTFAGQSAGVADDIAEGLEILDNFIASVRENGNYSTEATLTFIGQARQCFAAAPAPVSEPEQAFQARVKLWMLECFGSEIAADTVERNHRFFEEAGELVQACGMTASEAHQLVDYTWGRPVGEKSQEVGGVMVTLAALCLANGLDMHASGETELERISRPDMVIRIRAKQAAKPKHSPLPVAAAEQASERGEQDCPHGVDDGACKQCYGEAVRGEQGAALSQDECDRISDTYSLCSNKRDPIAAITAALRLAYTHGVLAASAPTLGGGAAPWQGCKHRVCYKNGACWTAGKCLEPTEPEPWPTEIDAQIKACALMILGICATRPQDEWPKRIEGRIRYMLSRLQPQAAEPKGLTSGQQETIRYAAAILDQEAYHKTANDLRALLANGE